MITTNKASLRQAFSVLLLIYIYKNFGDEDIRIKFSSGSGKL